MSIIITIFEILAKKVRGVVIKLKPADNPFPIKGIAFKVFFIVEMTLESSIRPSQMRFANSKNLNPVA